MNLRRKIEEKIKRKKDEIALWETSIREAQIYIDAHLETLKMLPKETVSRTHGMKLKRGSVAYEARAVIAKAGKPLHVIEILTAQGKETSKTNRISISGALGWYVRRDEIFTRPAGNTFGLKYMENDNNTLEREEPPDDFGLIEEDSEEN